MASVDAEQTTNDGRFKAGNTMGSRKGRPPRAPDLIKRCSALEGACVERLAEIIRDVKARHADQLTAIGLILGYSAGRPRMKADVNVEYSITNDFLLALQAINEKAGENAKLIDVKAEQTENVD